MLRKVNLAAALLATLLVTAAHAQAQKQTNGCHCANATLVGDTVGTQFGGGPVVNRTVNSGVELPSAGPVLGAGGATPRWNINFGSNVIRIDFLKPVAAYTAGASLVFSSLDPKLAGCPPAFISGIAVTTNKPATPFNVAAAATFGPHAVTVPIAPTAGGIDWKPGEFIEIRLNFACEQPTTPPSTTDPCCPPWNKELMKGMLFYQGSGSISAPYTLKFQPTAAFNGQMYAYLMYLNSINPAITGITIDWRLHDQGTNVNPLPPHGPQVGGTAYVTWNAGGGATPVINPANFFTLSPPDMAVGKWYEVHSGIYIEGGHRFFPNKCDDNDIFVRVQVMNAKGARGGQPVLEFSDGKRILKSVPVGADRER